MTETSPDSSDASNDAASQEELSPNGRKPPDPSRCWVFAILLSMAYAVFSPWFHIWSIGQQDMASLV